MFLNHFLLPLILILHHFIGVLSFNVDAGLANNYALKASFTVSSGNATAAQNIPNYNTNDGWTSDRCGPSGWLVRKDLNVIADLCSNQPSSCSSSSTDNTGLNVITDTTFQNMFSVKPDSTGVSQLTITFTVPTTIVNIDIRAVINSLATLSLSPSDGSSILKLDLNSSISWIQTFFTVSSTSKFSSLTITSQDTQGFGIFGIAVQNETCNEWVIADLGSNEQVAWIGLRAITDDAGSVIIYTSPDGASFNWQPFVFIPTSLWISYSFDNFQATVRTTRYIKVWFNITQSWEGSHLYAMKVFDQNGPYGPPYALDRANTRSYSDLLGLDILWGWGMNYEFPNHSYFGNGGPAFYRPIVSYVRQYHELGWDINDPTDTVNWTAMSEGKGTSSLSWVNWDYVYQSILLRNYTFVDVSIQFLNSNQSGETQFSQPKWTNPYKNAYVYGLGFAEHFGPSHLNLIQSVEIGNEPWDYDADFYVQVLEGMAQGFKDGDSKLLVLPGAFQADSPDYPPNGDNIFYNGKYLGYRVSQSALNNIDHLNTHCYSWATINGTSVGVMPEHALSSFKAYRNIMRWRDSNCPDKETWVTEWGWDGSDQCADSHCVSLTAQAAYGVRGLLMGAREGVDRLTWYWFYDNGWGLFGKSGVSIMVNTTLFERKPVFYSFLNFLSIFENHHHYAALVEGPDAYVYLLSPSSSNSFSHLVAWALIDGDNTTELTFTFTYSGATINGPAVEINTSTNGPSQLPTNTFQQQGNNWKVLLTAFPRAVQVTPVTSSSHNQHSLFSWISAPSISSIHIV